MLLKDRAVRNSKDRMQRGWNSNRRKGEAQGDRADNFLTFTLRSVCVKTDFERSITILTFWSKFRLQLREMLSLCTISLPVQRGSQMPFLYPL